MKNKPVTKKELFIAFDIIFRLFEKTEEYKNTNCPFEELCEVECIEALGRSCFLERLDATKIK